MAFYLTGFSCAALSYANTVTHVLQFGELTSYDP